MSPTDQPRPSLPRVAVSIGDANGIGIEVLVKALASPDLADVCRPVIVGNRRIISEYLRLLPLDHVEVGPEELVVSGRSFPIVDLPSDAELRPGADHGDAGRLAGDAILRATRMTIDGETSAMVTMPISKRALHLGGHHFPGHTEMIASMTGGVPLMVLMTEGLRVALATIHVPLAAVPGMITRELIADRLAQVDRMLRRDFGAERPRIAVLGLNPHAGEAGEIGREEIETIAPAVEQAREAGIDAEGPLPADGFFARFVPGAYDAVLAMYHDQGLIPLKFFARGGGVNFTANLPIVRTSPDHGVAYPIVGRGVASAESTLEAFHAAAAIAARRAAGQAS